ncbi:hypothetical protein SmphiM12_473 [Sinorhizobium phage phiM12]|uniref:Uncharacterized protein n=1 Tax=Sinorhizobium phage phiM12 TaxID=1357423 RepID=S5MQG3_9CAUD|nr:hypothetical protein AB690_gp147 [Sinorhizobium phage phiM12]AGR48105.1 hypothetical protein SmphiM12_473 [Sinorhizobium phage phiM12]
MSAFVVFYRRMSDAQIDQLHAVGCWSGSEAGIAYLDSEPRGEREPKYEGAIKHDTFEMAALVKDCDDKDELYDRMNSEWRFDMMTTCHTDFPRSMSKGDVVYAPDTNEWYYVAGFGFEPITDAKFIDYLMKKI